MRATILFTIALALMAAPVVYEAARWLGLAARAPSGVRADRPIATS